MRDLSLCRRVTFKIGDSLVVVSNALQDRPRAFKCQNDKAVINAALRGSDCRQKAVMGMYVLHWPIALWGK